MTASLALALGLAACSDSTGSQETTPAVAETSSQATPDDSTTSAEATDSADPATQESATDSPTSNETSADGTSPDATTSALMPSDPSKIPTDPDQIPDEPGYVRTETPEGVYYSFVGTRFQSKNQDLWTVYVPKAANDELYEAAPFTIIESDGRTWEAVSVTANTDPAGNFTYILGPVEMTEPVCPTEESCMILLNAETSEFIVHTQGL